MLGGNGKKTLAVKLKEHLDAGGSALVLFDAVPGGPVDASTIVQGDDLSLGTRPNGASSG